MRKDDLQDAYHSDPSLNLLVRRRLYSGWIWLWLESRSTTGKDEGRGEFNKQIQSPNHPPLRSSSSSCLVWINHSQRWMAFNVPVGPFINLRLAISCVRLRVKWNSISRKERSLVLFLVSVASSQQECVLHWPFVRWATIDLEEGRSEWIKKDFQDWRRNVCECNWFHYIDAVPRESRAGYITMGLVGCCNWRFA